MTSRKTRRYSRGSSRKQRSRKHRGYHGGRAIMLANMKEVPLCQCREPASNQPCHNKVMPNTLFCESHQHCPGSPLNGSEPPYEPEKWNNDPAVTKSHNCYSYFANRINPEMVEKCRQNKTKNCRQFFPQPGALHGDRFALNATERRNCGNVSKLIMADIPGLLRSTFHDKCPVGTSKGAMVVDEGNDYHFFRQDSDGLWSHKDGSNKVKRFDALKRKIVDPELTSRDYRWQGSDLNYEDFCAFYCVPRDHEIQLGQGGALLGAKKQAAGSQLPSASQVKPLGASWRDHRSSLRQTRRQTQRKTRLHRN